MKIKLKTDPTINHTMVWSLFAHGLIHDPQAVLHALLEIGVDAALEEHEIPRDGVVDLDVRGDAAVLQARDFDDVEVCEEGDVVDARHFREHAALHTQPLVHVHAVRGLQGEVVLEDAVEDAVVDAGEGEHGDEFGVRAPHGAWELSSRKTSS